MSKTIWFRPALAQEMNQWCKETIHDSLGIEITEIGDDFVRGTMPVDNCTKQPLGLLHGGASVVLVESLGSIASSLIINRETHQALGIEVNANHIRAVSSGKVTGTCKPIHIGTTLHVWQVSIEDEKGHLVCTARLTVLIREK